MCSQALRWRSVHSTFCDDSAREKAKRQGDMVTWRRRLAVNGDGEAVKRGRLAVVRDETFPARWKEEEKGFVFWF